jgi:site-specific DNA-cytosine methylase
MGFPCQDISSAGAQLGFEGTRSSLFLVAIKACVKMEAYIFSVMISRFK